MNKSIHFIITGGTIDSYYEGTKDTAVPYKESMIPQYIKGLKLNYETEFTQVCMKDSRAMNLEDMKNIKDTIEESKSNYFIITHGTYTMPDTARYLKSNLQRTDATVILTGAMVPLNFPNSDAGFNLGASVAKLSQLEPGVYVCMHSEIFNPDEVTKLIEEGKFVSMFTK